MSTAIKKLQYHVRTARALVAEYTEQAAQHKADEEQHGWSIIDIDNVDRLVELYEGELADFEAALAILEGVAA